MEKVRTNITAICFNFFAIIRFLSLLVYFTEAKPIIKTPSVFLHKSNKNVRAPTKTSTSIGGSSFQSPTNIDNYEIQSLQLISKPVRNRPAFEKLLIGPLMVFCEKITGGHYLEVLRLSKQMVTGKGHTPSYREIHQSLVSETGFIGAFYRGLYPWSLLECFKGLPVLFVQNECEYQLRTHTNCSETRAQQISGFLGGASQAFFVCPIQKVKVAIVASSYTNKLSPMQALRGVIESQGIRSLYDGLLPTIFRRSVDWGIRFSVSAEMKRYLVKKKQKRNEEKEEELSIAELFLCGFVGGAVSALTHPIDNIITNSQKPTAMGVSTHFAPVIYRMLSESGVQAFTRGFLVKVIDNAYHTAWMYGVGGVLYDLMERHKR